MADGPATGLSGRPQAVVFCPIARGILHPRRCIEHLACSSRVLRSSRTARAHAGQH